MKFKNHFPDYVAKVFNERIRELGMSKYFFLNKYADLANRPTLTRILRGNGGTNIATIAHYAELLGLEIVIRPKKKKDNGNKD